MSPEPPLREWVRPPLTPGNVARQWRRIEERLDASGARRGARWLWVGGLAGALALGAAALWVGTRDGASDGPSASVAAAGSVLSLSDGSKVSLDQAAELEVQRDEPRHVATVLRSGAARFEVVPDTTRPFTVVARGVEVRVVGTEFRVAVDGASEEVTVTVSKGIVEVRSPSRPDDVKRLHAGESWSTRPEPGSAKAAGDEEPAPTSPADPAASGSPAAPRAAALAASSDASAQKLFEAANQARRAGDLERAAALYRQLVAKHPNDARAQVAALELGRLEMERGQGANAEDALKTAASSAPGSSVHEDALARLVRLYDGQENRAACEEARRRYLTTYPNGIHIGAVKAACARR